MNTTRTFLALTSTAVVLVAGAAFVRSTPAAPTSNGSSVAVGQSSFGRILFDGRGYALYAFTRDTGKRATCYGVCAKAWPPYIVRARPSAIRGATASLVGVTRRVDGRLQATYAGRPLYYYVGDTKPGIVLCQNIKEFGGLWLVIRASGTLVR